VPVWGMARGRRKYVPVGSRARIPARERPGPRPTRAPDAASPQRRARLLHSSVRWRADPGGVPV